MVIHQRDVDAGSLADGAQTDAIEIAGGQAAFCRVENNLAGCIASPGAAAARRTTALHEGTSAALG